MSIIVGNGMLITYMETELVCPICTAAFDGSIMMEKAKLPVFKTKCPSCKSAIGISVPIFGGTTICFEWYVPKNVSRLETITPFEVNGKTIKQHPTNKR